ncbi:MAG: hypothetical protein RIT27_982 [Pseudomonadota bacterium]|jgi:hypothetical protein
MNISDPAPTLDDVWRLFRETDQQLKETDRQLKEQAREAERRSQETDRRFRETERFIKELSKETDKKIGRLTNRLGEFVEELIKPAVVRLFQTRGIPLHKVHSDVSVNNPQLNLATQIDLLVVNGDVCALIEVKSKLSIDDVNEHVERMEKFKPLFPEYADKKAFGAVASMVIAENVAKYAYKKGFFVIAQQGESVAFLNDDNFKPIAW